MPMFSILGDSVLWILVDKIIESQVRDIFLYYIAQIFSYTWPAYRCLVSFVIKVCNIIILKSHLLSLLLAQPIPWSSICCLVGMGAPCVIRTGECCWLRIWSFVHKVSYAENSKRSGQLLITVWTEGDPWMILFVRIGALMVFLKVEDQKDRSHRFLKPQQFYPELLLPILFPLLY